MTDTINNVPRELLEVIEQTWRIHYRGGPVTTDLAADAIEKGLGQLRTLLSAAQAPFSGVVIGGLDVAKDRFETELPAIPDDLHNAIQRAAAELPAGWEIRLSVEHEGGGVELLDEDGNQVDFPSNHERLVDTVNDAIAAALAASQSEGGAA